MPGLSVVPHNSHEVAVDGRRLLLHVPTTSLFELDPLAGDLLDLLREAGEAERDQVTGRLAGRYASEAVSETLDEMLQLGILRNGTAPAGEAGTTPVDDYPLSTLVLNINTGCNLSCTYCYKEDLTAPDSGRRMDEATAVRAFELLLEQAAGRSRVNLVFFGGEPLTNMPLIRRLVGYGERRGAELGKTVDFSLTTNATLLTEPLVDWFSEHRVGITVSMDGPKALHDRNRRTVADKGSYDLVARKVAMLLERHRTRPIGARVTLTPRVIDVEAIHHHLHDELGLFEVGYAPVTAGDNAVFNLSAEELGQVFANMKALGRSYRDQALAGVNNGFANMHQLMTDLAEGTRKALPCGAGLGMLAVDADGGLNLCHRFTGSSLPTFGDLDQGIDTERLGGFLEAAQRRDGLPCETCHIRNICSGGCYHERYARFGDPLHPAAHYCDLLRDWVDFGIGVYSDIMARNPSFLERHVAPRRPRDEGLRRALT